MNTNKYNELPEHLFAAHCWISAGGEWDEAVENPEQYSHAAFMNAANNEQFDVFEEDLLEVIEWHRKNKKMNRQVITNFPHLNFTVVADDLESDYSVTYTIYFNYDNKFNIEKLNKCCSGWIKFDGCSDWRLEQDHLHACTKEELVNFGLVMAECWEMAKEICPNWAPC